MSRLLLIVISLSVTYQSFAVEKNTHLKEPYQVVDFGWTTLDEPVFKAIGITNSLPSDIRIKTVSVSCDCLNVVRFPDSIPAGEIGEFEVLMLPDKLDEVNYRIQVEFADGAGCHEILFKGIVDEPSDSSFKTYGNLKHLLRCAKPGRISESDLNLYTDAVSCRADAVFVDIRSESDYRKFHIPESLNIPSCQIRTCTFLKSKPVVLVGGLHQTSELEDLSHTLVAAGFDQVEILGNGIYAWTIADNVLKGTDVGSVKLIEPKGVQEILTSPNWSVIAMEKSPRLESRVLLPGSQSLPSIEVGTGQQGLKENVLLISDDDGLAKLTLQEFNNSEFNVYYLKGGMKAYIRNLQIMSGMGNRGTATISYASESKRTTGAVKGGRRIKKTCGCSG